MIQKKGFVRQLELAAVYLLWLRPLMWNKLENQEMMENVKIPMPDL